MNNSDLSAKIRHSLHVTLYQGDVYNSLVNNLRLAASDSSGNFLVQVVDN